MPSIDCDSDLVVISSTIFHCVILSAYLVLNMDIEDVDCAPVTTCLTFAFNSWFY